MITLDTAKTPVITIAIIGGVIIFLAVVILLIVSKIRNLKLGHLHLQIAKEHVGTSSIYFMKVANEDHD